jgi:fatty acid synthase subunit alpha, fungi type
MSEMMITNSLVKIKDGPPYTPELEEPVLLNSAARATLDPKTGSYSFPKKLPTEVKLDVGNFGAVKDILGHGGSVSGVGIDQGHILLLSRRCQSLTSTAELIASVPSWNPTFLERNFTDREIDYCESQPSPSSSFAARWVGKEAVFKSLGVASKGAAAPMRDIEILPNDNGVPQVLLHGEAEKRAAEQGVTKVLVSLSHSEVRPDELDTYANHV